jgi:1,4-alpha-glucan branching enzyme
MMKRPGYIVIILVLLFGSIGTAVAQKRNTLTIADDRLVLRIDLKSPRKELDSILEVAGISKPTAVKLLNGDFAAINDDGWSISEHQDNIIQFNRPLTDLNNNPQSSPWLITTRIEQTAGRPGYPENILYGVNKFAKITVYELPTGLTRFILPGHENAKRVFLSGNFNDWSTLKGLMKKTDGGWMIDVMLRPGAYEYKYIISGNWRTDPNNLLQMDDGAGNINSVYYKYNHTFKLPGYASAQRITVTGDFNKWDGNELLMEKKGNNWVLQMYLIDGKHLYRFLIDGKTVIDPANPAKENDENGTSSSILNLGETVKFKLSGHLNAKKVMLAGNFNHWNPNELYMKRTANGWVLPLTLAAGNYNYKFIADSGWLTDPVNPCYAVEDGITNSFVPVKPNYTFKLKGNSDAKNVKLIGTFSKWEKGEYTLAHIGDEWTIALYLKPGKYIYEFVVDGQRIKDPANKLWEPGEDDTNNSVLWIE